MKILNTPRNALAPGGRVKIARYPVYKRDRETVELAKNAGVPVELAAAIRAIVELAFQNAIDERNRNRGKRS